MIVDDIAALLRQKQQLDQDGEQANNMVSYDRWAFEAMELLLRVALEQEKKGRKPK